VLAGSALLPITVIVLLFSARSGALAQRIGPRLQMTFGPWVIGVALLLGLTLDQDSSYLTDVLPVVTVFGAGLAMMVAPLTAAALGAAPIDHAGIASGVNNAVARVANLLAIAAIPAATGLTGAGTRTRRASCRPSASRCGSASGSWPRPDFSPPSRSAAG
jgi:hypothetical protein